MCIKAVVGSLFALTGFSLSTQVFPYPQNPTFLNSTGHRFVSHKTVKGYHCLLNKVDSY